jgi:glycolate oxidase iron-sulfur subunit
MARAVTACVHCGFCLAACPTYRVLGEEMDSPRGRIVLMKQALEGNLSLGDALPYIDRCLGCLACETACPSGVRYRDLVVPFRARAEARVRPAHERLARRALLSVLESPARFRLAVTAGSLARALSPLVPPRMRAMLSLLPPSVAPAEPLPEHVPAVGRQRARVGLLTGCVQRVLRPSINSATVRVLSANGVDVVIPRAQGCCGALASHAGFHQHGHRLAAHNDTVFPRDLDAIVTNAAGCGSAMKERDGAVPVRDVSEFLDAIGLAVPLAFEAPTLIAYHDACHLSHGQGVRSAPRRLLASIANVTLAEIADADSCCGSAGLYNLEHPAIATDLGRGKAEAIIATGAREVATGNIGCLTQIAVHLATARGRRSTDAAPLSSSAPASQQPIRVRHTIEVLDAASIHARDPIDR